MRFSATSLVGCDLHVCEISNRWLVRKYLNQTEENTLLGDSYSNTLSSAPKFFGRGGARFRGRWISMQSCIPMGPRQAW